MTNLKIEEVEFANKKVYLITNNGNLLHYTRCGYPTRKEAERKVRLLQKALAA